ncbi:DUF6321 domain-containing protein [Bradyrhizobium sp. 2TAF36]|uniref:DUF6321 domain-containing protein n=1 Tax=Bradyrhizobium sp. 2TAF36 TaxID=3233016 RepID=UPI003F8DA6E3
MAEATRKSAKDLKGGLTAAGWRKLAKRNGSRLKPGFKKSATSMTLAEMCWKGSWAVRFHGRKKMPPLGGQKRQADPARVVGPRVGGARAQDGPGQRQAPSRAISEAKRGQTEAVADPPPPIDPAENAYFRIVR